MKQLMNKKSHFGSHGCTSPSVTRTGKSCLPMSLVTKGGMKGEGKVAGLLGREDEGSEKHLQVLQLRGTPLMSWRRKGNLCQTTNPNIDDEVMFATVEITKLFEV